MEDVEELVIAKTFADMRATVTELAQPTVIV